MYWGPRTCILCTVCHTGPTSVWDWDRFDRLYWAPNMAHFTIQYTVSNFTVLLKKKKFESVTVRFSWRFEHQSQTWLSVDPHKDCHGLLRNWQSSPSDQNSSSQFQPHLTVISILCCSDSSFTVAWHLLLYTVLTSTVVFFGDWSPIHI